MFREMRRKNQLLSKEETLEVLTNSTSGVLAVLGDDDYPYAVPLSYVWDGTKLYFHCATSGHKFDAIQKHSKVSFCVIDRDRIVPEKYTTYYRSVIVFGRAYVVTDAAEKRASIEKLAVKYAPKEPAAHMHAEIDGAWDRFHMVAIEIEHMTGKKAVELF